MSKIKSAIVFSIVISLIVTILFTNLQNKENDNNILLSINESKVCVKQYDYHTVYDVKSKSWDKSLVLDCYTNQNNNGLNFVLKDFI